MQIKEIEVNRRVVAGCALFLLFAAGCVSPYSGGPSQKAKISQVALYSYLEQAELARPEVVKDIRNHLWRGDRFRKRIRDQRNRWCLATVWIDKRNNLNIVTSRDEPCPKCKGTGNRNLSSLKITNQVPFEFRCLECEGTGVLKNHTVPRRFALSPLDFADPEAARARRSEAVWSHAPPEAKRYVAQLGSDDPRRRLAACEWLDRNYVRIGGFFQDYMPMLKKARRREASEKRTVWQFYAGKDIPSQAHRAYYRIYIANKTGKVIEKGFYPAR